MRFDKSAYDAAVQSASTKPAEADAGKPAGTDTTATPTEPGLFDNLKDRAKNASAWQIGGAAMLGVLGLVLSGGGLMGILLAVGMAVAGYFGGGALQNAFGGEKESPDAAAHKKKVLDAAKDKTISHEEYKGITGQELKKDYVLITPGADTSTIIYAKKEANNTLSDIQVVRADKTLVRVNSSTGATPIQNNEEGYKAILEQAGKMAAVDGKSVDVDEVAAPLLNAPKKPEVAARTPQQ